MGAGFQLVETKSVTGMSILFGSAWWIDGQAPGVLREMIFSHCSACASTARGGACLELARHDHRRGA